jgi:hypothetical protein
MPSCGVLMVVLPAPTTTVISSGTSVAILVWRVSFAIHDTGGRKPAGPRPAPQKNTLRLSEHLRTIFQRAPLEDYLRA